MIKVSIIIPVYNTEKYLEACIKSALNQTYTNCEVIAVDDGSTDNSLKILEKFSDKITIIHKSNGGTPTALNAGIKKMTGDWFKWLSSDDLLKKNTVEVLINNVENIPDSESCIFYTNYDSIDSSGKVVDEFKEPNYNNLSLFQRNTILLDNFYGNGTTCLIHKSTFEKYGLFDEKIGFQEDYEFWLRCCILHNMKLYLVEKNLAQYRVHDGQLTQIKVNESLSHAQFIRKFVLDQLPKKERTEYELALKKYEKQYPLKVKIRKTIRNVMFSIFPKNVSDIILGKYMERKRTRN